MKLIMSKTIFWERQTINKGVSNTIKFLKKKIL